ncbi:hypothetical protein D9615_007359 [Tricholomella constricta]|uniref:Amino acid permease/ SLC12A domain-containing protein n=1 Tax=Tricholomella constricta TaxID=117010 RepID=A0A8H5LXK0_9AGAR|nr:hypothetical protein D9615_007359 [Tricholomella constricta]
MITEKNIDSVERSTKAATPTSEVTKLNGSNQAYHLDVHDLDRVQRRLKQRHVQMIAIAGTIGTGLFLGSGHALQGAGPLGALIAYALVGTVAYASLCSVAEMTTFAPISGTFPHYAGRWVDPALGFAVGWNYFYINAISTPSEISAAKSHVAIYTALPLAAHEGGRWFGEVSFFSIAEVALLTISLEVSLILALLLSGLIIDLGGGPQKDRIGFRYWKHPGALAGAGLVSNINTDRFLGILTVLVQAAFSFQSIELVAIAASEAESPRRNITKAVRRVFWRIFIFYILGVIVIGMLVAYNDEALLDDTGTAAQSPFVIAMNRAGVKVFPHIINAGIFTSAFSAGNSFIYCSSRILYGLALRGQAPRIFAYCTKKGLPLNAGCFALLSFMTVSSGSETVFNWFVNLSTTAGFASWFSINLTYIFFYRGMKAQGFDLKRNAYNNPWQPYVAYWGVGWNLFFILVTGFDVFFNFTAADFLTSYLNIPIFASLYIGYKLFKRTHIWKPEDMDFITGIPSPEETETPEIPPKNIWERIAGILF